MGHAGDRHVHAHVEVLGQHVVFGHAAVVEDGLELAVEVLRLAVVAGGVRQVTRPSLSRVTRLSGLGRSSVVSHQSTACAATSLSDQRGARKVSLGSSPFIAPALDLPTIWMLPSGHGAAVAGQVEVVDPEGLLEHGVVRFRGQGDGRLAVVEHVVAPDLVRPVGQTVRMGVVGRGQEELGAVGGAGRDDDDVGGVDLALPVRSTSTPVTVWPPASVSSALPRRSPAG